MNQNNWPSDFPENCPPKEAKASGDVFYRLVDSVPPTKDDFLRTCDEPRNKGRDIKSANDAVNIYGVSIFRDKNDAWKVKDKYKRPMKNKRLVSGALNSNLGVIAQTYKPSHHTLWLYENADPETVINQEVIRKTEV
ncbi:MULTISPECIES: hypothetical protein [Aeromonas]|uniref:hypothetical protein n=1 Tax=Aeromonas TaxID=642 RepID=UPI001111D034|nr:MULTISPECIES: hypothetical protein [Aeromonas]MDD9212094.1 hypothetical protein [Aeromonas dhakensis]CAD7507830.1 hypothetical protein KBAH04_02870 [Aeromonas hydrophila]